MILQRCPRYGLLAAFFVAALYLASYRDGPYQLGRFVMGAYNDHAEAQDIVEAYRQAFRFVEEQDPDAVVAANYPGAVMARDPRLGYVARPHEVQAIPSTADALPGRRDAYLVVSRYPARYPAWVNELSKVRRRDFVVGQKSVAVLWGFRQDVACDDRASERASTRKAGRP